MFGLVEFKQGLSYNAHTEDVLCLASFKEFFVLYLILNDFFAGPFQLCCVCPGEGGLALHFVAPDPGARNNCYLVFLSVCWNPFFGLNKSMPFSTEVKGKWLKNLFQFNPNFQKGDIFDK